MPGRNILKYYDVDSFYHVYNRGINRAKIFLDKTDYNYFEWLLARSLGPRQLVDSKRRPYTWHRGNIELNAYCLMPNHYHMLVYQTDVRGVELLMKTVANAYTMYFNKKYKRRGPMFENVFRAVQIISDEQLQHITRYIHLNHWDYKQWAHSSYSDYLSANREWIAPDRILELFDSKMEYDEFVNDYEALQRENDFLKAELATY